MDTGTTASSPFLPGWGPGQSQGRDSRPPDSRVLVLGDGSRVTAHPYTTVAPNSSSRPPKSGKGCLILCGVLVVAALLGAGLILGLSGRNKDKSPSKDYYPNNVPSNIPNNIPNRNKPEIESTSCRTSQCKAAVALMRSSIDESFSPCDDFYKYACGGWIRLQSSVLNQEKSSSNLTSTTELGLMDKNNIKWITKLIEDLPTPVSYLPTRTVNEKIKRFWNSCYNQKSLLFLLDLLTASDNSTSGGKDVISNNLPDGLGELELQEWSALLKELHPSPESIPDYLKFALELNEDDPETKSTICTHFARELIPEGVAQLYVLSHYMDDPKTDAGVNSLLDRIWSTFRTMMTSSAPWISDHESRLNLTSRIRGLSVVSGFLSDILNSTHVASLYANVSISDHFLLNLKELIGAKIDRKETEGAIGQFFLEFYKDTSKATAFYMQLLDTIFIPAGIVQTPAFHHSFPEILKYSKLGTTVAHEFAHSLHPYIEGIVFESSLLPTPLRIADGVVTTRTQTRYQERSQCVIDQYNTLKITLPSGNASHLPINGSLTVRENVADIIGLQVAFRSFLNNAATTFRPLPGLSEQFSKEQIFFLASAQGRCHAFLDDATESKFLANQVDTDVHSPGAVRVLGAMRNFEEFATAWNCPVGSKYNPRDKCTFFKSFL